MNKEHYTKKCIYMEHVNIIESSFEIDKKYQYTIIQILFGLTLTKIPI